jgi:hypothetical protein
MAIKPISDRCSVGLDQYDDALVPSARDIG